MKKIIAILFFATSSAFAAGGTHVLQGDAVNFSSVTDSALTNGDCVQAGAGGTLTSASGACGSGGGGGGGSSTSTVLINGVVLNSATTSFNLVQASGVLVTGSSPTANGVNINIGPDTSILASRATAAGGSDATCICTSMSSMNYVGAAQGNALLAYTNGMPVRVQIDSTTWGNPITLNCGAGAVQVYQNGATSTSSSAPTTSQWVGGTVQSVVYSGAVSGWVLQSGASGSSSSGGSGIVSPGTFTWVNTVGGITASTFTVSTGGEMAIYDPTNANPYTIFNNASDNLIISPYSGNAGSVKLLGNNTSGLYFIDTNHGIFVEQSAGLMNVFAQDGVRIMNGGQNNSIALFGAIAASGENSNFYTGTVYIPTAQTGITTTTAISPTATYMRILSTGSLVQIGATSVAIATATATDGQIVILESTSSVSDVEIATGTAAGVWGSTTPLLINAVKTIEFVYDATLSVWKELHD